jgi:hypothetical protein
MDDHHIAYMTKSSLAKKILLKDMRVIFLDIPYIFLLLTWTTCIEISPNFILFFEFIFNFWH